MLCESRGGRPLVSVDVKQHWKTKTKATLNPDGRGQELCESGGGRRGLPVLNGPYGLSVDVKQQ